VSVLVLVFYRAFDLYLEALWVGRYSSTFRFLLCFASLCLATDDQMALLSLPKRRDRQVCRKVGMGTFGR